MEKIKVGILGATGMVGQRFVQLLQDHPWFQVVAVAASPRSAGKTYEEAVKGKWKIDATIPNKVKSIKVVAVEEDINKIVSEVDFVFSALDLDKDKIGSIEELYASKDCPVVSNNSAHRWTADVPMIIPEINPQHTDLIDIQRKDRRWNKGFIVVKPNCSIQSYVPVIKALESYKPRKLIVTALQAISGAGKTFETWPEMNGNIIPLIKGEEAKSEKEPMKILGKIKDSHIEEAKTLTISATCIRVPVIDGHMTSVDIELEKKISKEKFVDAIVNYKNPISDLNLPSAPKQFMKYFEEEDRPQTRIDRDIENGMGITVGRLRQDSVLGWKFVSLSHNTIRGAAGGAILVAELLKAKGYLGK
ncbi:aspartate-semialdehyde dehydrogenase [Candidatus Woesearchaeota archaeon]|nr:aspartate-semialdehyde dehydrogenase [Candidatus Woesearchaeota archaeon]